MRKKPINFLPQDNNLIVTCLNQKEILFHFKISLLLALLEKNQITQYQFDQCEEELQKFHRGNRK